MGKTSQTYRNYYCNSCQDLAEYNISAPITDCALEYEYITNTLWNQMISRLQKIEEFGDYEANSIRKPTNASNLSSKNDWDIIEYSDYVSLLNTIDKQLDIHEHEHILGAYTDDLKTEILNYKIPTTRYKHSQCVECCDNCEANCQTTCQLSCQNCLGSCQTTCEKSCQNCQGQAQNCVSIYYGTSCPSCNRFQ